MRFSSLSRLGRAGFGLDAGPLGGEPRHVWLPPCFKRPGGACSRQGCVIILINQPTRQALAAMPTPRVPSVLSRGWRLSRSYWNPASTARCIFSSRHYSLLYLCYIACPLFRVADRPHLVRAAPQEVRQECSRRPAGSPSSSTLQAERLHRIGHGGLHLAPRPASGARRVPSPPHGRRQRLHPKIGTVGRRPRQTRPPGHASPRRGDAGCQGAPSPPRAPVVSLHTTASLACGFQGE